MAVVLAQQGTVLVDGTRSSSPLTIFGTELTDGSVRAVLFDSQGSTTRQTLNGVTLGLTMPEAGRPSDGRLWLTGTDPATGDTVRWDTEGAAPVVSSWSGIEADVEGQTITGTVSVTQYAAFLSNSGRIVATFPGPHRLTATSGGWWLVNDLRGSSLRITRPGKSCRSCG